MTSLELAEHPEKVIDKYKSRMTIEEGFRDTKSVLYGFSFNLNHTIKPERYIVWLLLAALAAFIAWIMGFLAEKNKLHRHFQANTYRHKRVLSFVFLGCRIINKKITLLYKCDSLKSIFQEAQK